MLRFIIAVVIALCARKRRPVFNRMFRSHEAIVSRCDEAVSFFEWTMLFLIVSK